uniref:glycosyltransferase n=1 Tax=Gelidibacter sp. TaxID=2018083 RepID=UPI00404A3E94
MTSNKINITFVTPNLFAGGAERVISFLAKEFNREKFNVTLVVFGYQKDASYDIEGVNTIFFDKIRVLNGAFSMFKYLLKHKPDVVLSVIAHLNTVIAYQSVFFPKTKFIAREVSVLSVLDSFDQPQNWALNILYKNRFKFFDAVICQSHDMFEDIQLNFKLESKKLNIIHNPITNDFEVKTQLPKDNVLRCITIGRLSKEKGIDRVLIALSKLSIPFHYTLIGKGSEKNRLFQLIKDLNLSDKVTYIDFTNDVGKYLAVNDVYLQGSFVEGFPNALVESCAVGTPFIAFNAPGGLKDIFIENKNGYVAENEKEFIECIQNIYTNNTFVPELVSESVYSKFNKTKILKQYEDLIIKINA